MGIVDQLMKIGGLGPESRREIEFQLACAVIHAQQGVRRKSINWSASFPWLKATLREKQRNRCFWCSDQMLDDGAARKRPTIEHVVPLAVGGEDAPSNLAIACDGCNNDRSVATSNLRKASQAW